MTSVGSLPAFPIIFNGQTLEYLQKDQDKSRGGNEADDGVYGDTEPPGWEYPQEEA